MKNNEIDPKIKMLPWIIWGLAAGFFFLGYVARVAPGVMVPQLSHAFSINAFYLGGLSAFFYYAYLPMQIPAGILIDRFGTRTLLLISILMVACACLLFAQTSNIHIAYCSRFFIGFGCTFSFIGAIKLASTWLPSKYLGMLAGSTQAAGMLGAIVGGLPLAYTVAKFGWRNSMMLIAAALFILLALVFYFVKDLKSTQTYSTTKLPNKQNRTEKVPLLSGLITVIKNPQNWLNVLYAGAIYAPMAAFGEFWGTGCLQRIYHIPIQTAAAGIGIMFLGWTIGSPLIGWFSDRIGRRKPLMLASAICSCMFLSTIFYLPNLSITSMFILLFLFGFSNTGLVIAYTLAAELNAKKIAATSTALINMASVIFGALGQPLIGFLLELNWKGVTINGLHHYSATNFRFAMSILPICLITGCVAALLIKETYCKTVDDKSIVELTPSDAEAELPLADTMLPLEQVCGGTQINETTPNDYQKNGIDFNGNITEP
jgi:MFS family permease